MLTVMLGKINIDLKSLDNFIKDFIPAGMNANESITDGSDIIEALRCYSYLKRTTYLKKSLGSLGGGNHFIEIDKDNDDNLYLIIHTGSRNLGKQVCEYYQKLAISKHESYYINKKKMINDMIIEYKKCGREKEISTEIKRISELEIKINIPKDLAYVEGEDFNNYIHDMDICQKYATDNRYIIAKRILEFLGLDINNYEYFHTIHNYIDIKNMILRKGAISANLNELVLIPLNMKDGCIIGVGLGNPDYNFSAPHGAGRIMSREQAKKQLSLDDFIKSMDGIYTSTVSKETLDEAPMVYKNPEDIINNIKDTVKILKIIKPIYNFKAGE